MYPADWVVAIMAMPTREQRKAALDQCPEAMRDAVRNVVAFNFKLRASANGKQTK